MKKKERIYEDKSLMIRMKSEGQTKILRVLKGMRRIDQMKVNMESEVIQHTEKSHVDEIKVKMFAHVKAIQERNDSLDSFRRFV